MGKTATVKHERRRAPRARKQVQLDITRDGDVATCLTEDVSTHGISCFFPHELALFTMYDVTLALSPEERLETTGVVVRNEPVNVNGQTLFRVALFFSRISPDDKQRLQEYLDHH